MQKTMLLDQTAWDLVLDANADIAYATDPYSIAHGRRQCGQNIHW